MPTESNGVSLIFVLARQFFVHDAEPFFKLRNNNANTFGGFNGPFSLYDIKVVQRALVILCVQTRQTAYAMKFGKLCRRQSVPIFGFKFSQVLKHLNRIIFFLKSVARLIQARRYRTSNNVLRPDPARALKDKLDLYANAVSLYRFAIDCFWFVFPLAHRLPGCPVKAIISGINHYYVLRIAVLINAKFKNNDFFAMGPTLTFVRESRRHSLCWARIKDESTCIGFHLRFVDAGRVFGQNEVKNEGCFHVFLSARATINATRLIDP